ncbi:hypothetical protein BE20_40240, partial [Sorangium cellulosum]
MHRPYQRPPTRPLGQAGRGGTGLVAKRITAEGGCHSGPRRGRGAGREVDGGGGRRQAHGG